MPLARNPRAHPLPNSATNHAEDHSEGTGGGRRASSQRPPAVSGCCVSRSAAILWDSRAGRPGGVRRETQRDLRKRGTRRLFKQTMLWFRGVGPPGRSRHRASCDDRAGCAQAHRRARKRPSRRIGPASAGRENCTSMVEFSRPDLPHRQPSGEPNPHPGCDRTVQQGERHVAHRGGGFHVSGFPLRSAVPPRPGRPV